MVNSTGAQPKRGPKAFSDAQRFDLALWNPDGRIDGLVELKNAPAMDRYRFVEDTCRVARAIDCWGVAYGGSLSYGIVLFSHRLSKTQLARNSNEDILRDDHRCKI